MSGRYYSVNGHRIYAETHGPKNGHALVLLHHGIGAVRSWKEQVPVFADAGYRVIVYDRWGHGKSDARTRYGMPYFEADLEDLGGLLGELGIQQATFIGHSDGGKIAMYYAADNPERVDGLVIVAAQVYIETKMGFGIQSVLQDFHTDPKFQGKLRRVHGDKTEALFKGWYEGWTDTRNLEWDMRPVLKDISCPALVIQGLQDEHSTPQHAQAMAASLPDAVLWLLPGAGHMLPQDYPDEFNRRVLDFLARTAQDG